MKNILHLSYSKSGGAGRVAQTLSTSLINLPDYKSDFIFKIQNDLWSNPTRDPRSSITAVVDNFLVKKLTFQPLFSLYREKTDKKFYEIMRNHNGILHFHWMNGLIDFKDLLKSEIMEKPIVWTIHDMNPLTGGCHYSLNCQGHEGACVKCPAVRDSFNNRVSKNKSSKNLFFSKKEKIKIVVPSNWLAKKMIDSHNIEDKKLKVIPNPVDSMFFQNRNKNEIRKKLNLPQEAFILGFVSQNLNNPLKNIKHLIDLLNNVQSRIKKELIILGIGKASGNFEIAKFRVISTGSIGELKKVVENYSAIDIIVSTSLAETFGLSIAEAASLGIPSLVTNGTATAELVVNAETGFIANNDEEFIRRVIELAKDENLRIRLGQNAKIFAEKNFKIKNVIKQYDKIYKEL